MRNIYNHMVGNSKALKADKYFFIRLVFPTSDNRAYDMGFKPLKNAIGCDLKHFNTKSGGMYGGWI